MVASQSIAARQPRVDVGQRVGDDVGGGKADAVEAMGAIAVPGARPLQPIRLKPALRCGQINNRHRVKPNLALNNYLVSYIASRLHCQRNPLSERRK